MGSHQMSERQVLESIVAEAINVVFKEYVTEHGLDEISEIFGKGVRIEVGDMIESSKYAERLKQVPPAWEKAFEVNSSSNEAVRAACVEFVLAGLYSVEKISRFRTTVSQTMKRTRRNRIRRSDGFQPSQCC